MTHTEMGRNYNTNPPIEFLQDLIDHEWKHAEASGGKTFMGNVVKGVTRKLMDTQNPLLYGKSHDK